MSQVFPDLMTVACRACGATRAIASNDGPEDVCWNCWSDRHRVDGEFNEWLARKLVREVRRLKTYGVTGRCEAISNPPYGYKGFQCGGLAITTREGRRVCSAHSERRATRVSFIDADDAVDQYEMLGNIVRELAAVDDRFAATLIEAVLSSREAKPLQIQAIAL